MAHSYDPIVKLNDLIQGIECAMLTTIRSNGSLHSCPMATQSADSSGALWFFSSNNSEKVEAIKADARVNLSYPDLAGQRYVSVSGHCEPVRDHIKAKQLWKPDYQAWFPKGLDDPDLILLKVHIHGAEYWDAAQGRMVKLDGFPPQP